MPAVSGSPSQEATTQPTVAALESVEVSQFGDGDLALVQAGDVFYVLDVESIAPRVLPGVLYTRNSNPLYTPTATASTPGRWILLANSLACSCPTGPTGVTGPNGSGGSANSAFTNLGQDAATVNPAFVTLLTLPITTTGGRLFIEATIAANAGAAGPGTGSFSIGVDGDVPPLPGKGFAIIIAGNKPVCGAIVFRTAPLAAGAHTVTLYWRADASFPMAINPVSQPDHEHASLYVEEVP